MPNTVENKTFSSFYDIAYGENKLSRNGLLNQQELDQLLTAPNPCLVVIKPHAVNRSELINTTESLIFDLGLTVLIDKKAKFSRDQVFGLYGDLFEVMAQGEEGVAFVDGLVSSFVDSQDEARVIIVCGQDSYLKMRKVKKVIRELGKEDRFRNVLHTSDNLNCAMKEITALLPK